MEKKKMRKEIKDKKVNINYLVFISKLVDSKIEIVESNIENIEKLYSEIVNLKFSNLSRVSGRNGRKEVIEKRNLYLSEKLNIDSRDYEKVNKKVRKLVNIRDSKYI